MTVNSKNRYPSIDALRGLAMVWMTLFHFFFDLKQMAYIEADFYRDPFWTWQRTAIVGLFLFCAGISQALAQQQGQSWSHFWRRWRQIAAGAALVSVGSYALYPDRFIYFGILHGIALMLIVARLTIGWGAWLWLLGGLSFVLSAAAALLHSTWPELDFLNEPAFNWLGLISRKPATEDYVPLLPWLTLMWWGMASGRWLIRYQTAGLLQLQLPAALLPLAQLGRWSLSYYLLHQPVLFGLLWIFSLLR